MLPSVSSSGAKADDAASQCGAVDEKTSTDQSLCSKPKPYTQAPDSVDGRFRMLSTAVGNCCTLNPTPKARRCKVSEWGPVQSLGASSVRA